LKNKKSSAGKGDSPRNCESKDFKKNYEKIDWGKKRLAKQKKV
jgi:hypothetical protein